MLLQVGQAGAEVDVLSERLRKLSGYGLLEKHSFAEVPPRTEYALTPVGKRLIAIVRQLQTLDAELHSAHSGAD